MTNVLAQHPALKRGVYTALVLLLAALLFVLWVWAETREGKAVQQLPDTERHALFERTLHNLTGPCTLGTRPSGLEEFCQQQAEFVLEFPECDSACQQMVRARRSPSAR